MKALLLRISFFEAFFKVHYTKGFRLSYPIPLPTTVAGIFGAMLGIERGKLLENFKGMYFGAKFSTIKKENNKVILITENATFLQYKSKGIEKGVTTMNLLNEPSYLIAIAGQNEKIKEVAEKIENKVVYLPYGGQNDFFVKDWKIVGMKNVKEEDKVTNYAPQDWVENVILESGSEIQILPVMHKLSINPNFYFVINGKLKLKQKISIVEEEEIGLYELSKFNYH